MTRALVVVLLTAAFAGAGDKFVHPARAYALTLPDGWSAHAYFDAKGVPFYVFSPDPAPNFVRGIWVHSVPIPVDTALALENVARMAAGTMKAIAPGLQADPDTMKPIDVNGLKAGMFSISGNGWRGETVVALQEDNFLVVTYGAPAGEWEKIRKLAGAVGFTGAAKIAVRDPAAKPAKREDPAAVLPKLKPVTPLLTLLGANGQPLPNHGSGLIVSADGYVITSRRAIRALAGKRELLDAVRLSFDHTVRKDTVDADVIAVSHRYDLALLKIRGDGKWPTIPLAPVADVKTAHRALLVGWPDPRQFGSASLNQNVGSVASIPRDGKGRPREYRLGARAATGEEGGNSGGPVYNLNLGGVIGLLSTGITYEHGDAGVTEVLYERATPARWIVWEFPQVLAKDGPRGLSLREREALIAHYFLQDRWGAAMLECRGVLAAKKRNGIANLYMYRMLAELGMKKRSERYLKYALVDDRTKLLAMLAAGNAAVRRGDKSGSTRWAGDALKAAPMSAHAYLLLARATGPGNWSAERANQMSGGNDPEILAYLGESMVNKWLSTYKVFSFFDKRHKLPDQQRLKAEMLLEKSLDLWPAGNGRAHVYLAILAGFNNDAQTLKQHREAALKEGPDDPDTVYGVAFLDLMLKQPASALELAAPMLEVAPTAQGRLVAGWAQLQVAELWRRTGKVVEGERLRATGTRLVDSVVRSMEPWDDFARGILGGGEAIAPLKGSYKPAGPTPPDAVVTSVKLNHNVAHRSGKGFQLYCQVLMKGARGVKCWGVVRITTADGKVVIPADRRYMIGKTAGASSWFTPQNNRQTWEVRVHMPLAALWRGKGRREFKLEFWIQTDKVKLTAPRVFSFNITNK